MTRAEIIEAMAEYMAAGRGKVWADLSETERYPYHVDAEYALQALTGIVPGMPTQKAAIPGLAALLDGTAVVVPVEATADMIRDGVSFRLNTSLGGDNGWPENTKRLYAAMLSASPYRRPTDGE